jgi:hypothetical protein
MFGQTFQQCIAIELGDIVVKANLSAAIDMLRRRMG